MRHNFVRGVIPLTLSILVLLTGVIFSLGSCEKQGNKFHKVLSFVPPLEESKFELICYPYSPFQTAKT